MLTSAKNNMISVWRVIFSYAIVFVHFFNQYGHFTGWYIGVEFFFIVSGWLLSADLEKKNRNTYVYTWSRFKRLYPEYFWAFLVSALLYALYIIYISEEVFCRGFSMWGSVSC